MDNVITDFINKTENKEGFESVRRAAIYERNIGLGVLGLHSLYQKKHLPFESPMAKGLNLSIFKHLRTVIDKYQETLPPCPMAKEVGINRRNIHCLAVAPTMSVATLAGVASSGIEPWITNRFIKKVKQGSFTIKNKYLDKHIKQYAFANQLGEDWVEKQWESIKKNEGSVQHLDWMEDWSKDVFKTAFEIDQRYIIEQAADRAKYIDQSQSVNIFIPAESSTQYISDLHILAWKKGLKGLYYLRSTALNRADVGLKERKTIQVKEIDIMSDTCLSCS